MKLSTIPPDSVVVDNPPFSILSKIIDFYCGREIKFFLFGPELVLLSSGSKQDKISYLATGESITYENGAKVATGFITNLEKTPIIGSCGALGRKLREINRLNEGKSKRVLTKHQYPDSVLTVAKLKRLATRGIDLNIDLSKCHFIRRLDCQVKHKKAIYGAGYLMSSGLTAEVKSALQIADSMSNSAQTPDTFKWELSEREQQIINELDKK